MSKRMHRRDYNPEFRLQTCRLIWEEKMTVAQVAKDMGVDGQTLYKWLSNFRKGVWCTKTGSTIARVAQGASERTNEVLTAERREILELQRKVKRLTQEREILKKAMAYCVNLPT